MRFSELELGQEFIDDVLKCRMRKKGDNWAITLEEPGISRMFTFRPGEEVTPV